MSGNEDQQLILLILIIGFLLIGTTLIKLLLERVAIPPIVGFLLLGFAIRSADPRLTLLPPLTTEIFHFLAQIGVISLLFKAGLESDLKGLLSQLRRASLVWVADVSISGMLGFLSAYYLLKLGMITSLFIGTALTATSVGISLAVWQEARATSSKNGELLLDVAELDDISAVVLMALLFSLLPVLHNGQEVNLSAAIASTTGIFFLKLVCFGLLCYFFASFAEHPLVHFFRKLDPPPLPMITVMGIGLVIAGLAGILGFSAAIGAFFAGLVFSNDSETVKMEASFLPLYHFFTPFFFIGIGFDISPQSLEGIALIGAVLFVVAVGGKLLANCLPIWIMKDFPSGLIIGVSMIPRAEIAMVIMQRGLQLGEWAVPAKVFGGMALLTMVTCSVSPLAVKWMLKKWPQNR